VKFAFKFLIVGRQVFAAGPLSAMVTLHAAVPLVYQDEAALWDFLIDSNDPYACRLDKAAEQTARAFFAGLDPRKVLIDQRPDDGMCESLAQTVQLKCLSCSGRLLSNDQAPVRSAVDETRKGFEFFQVVNGGETRFGHYAVDTGEIIWPKNKVIQGKDAERLQGTDFKRTICRIEFCKVDHRLGPSRQDSSTD
jgi:hypothetical protein